MFVLSCLHSILIILMMMGGVSTQKGGEKLLCVYCLVFGRLNQTLLKCHLSYWSDVLKAPAHILDIVKNGYKYLLFQCYLIILAQIALLNKDFVGKAVVELSTLGCVKEVSGQPYVCSPCCSKIFILCFHKYKFKCFKLITNLFFPLAFSTTNNIM